MEQQAKLVNTVISGVHVVASSFEPSDKDRVLQLFNQPVEQRFPRYTTKKYIPRGFEEELMDEIANTTCAVRVIEAVSGTGKTLVVNNIAEMLRISKRVKGAFVVRDYTGADQYTSLTKWLLEKKFGVSPCSDIQCLTDILPPSKSQSDAPYLLVLDQLEDVFGHPDMKRFTKVLAQNCCNTSNLTVVACVYGKAPADTMIDWNGNTKIKKMVTNIRMPEAVVLKMIQMLDWLRS